LLFFFVAGAFLSLLAILILLDVAADLLEWMLHSSRRVPQLQTVSKPHYERSVFLVPPGNILDVLVKLPTQI